MFQSETDGSHRIKKGAMQHIQKAPFLIEMGDNIQTLSRSIFKTLNAIDINSQNIGHAKLGFYSFGASRQRSYHADLKIVSDFAHDHRIRQLGNRYLEPFGNIGLGLLNPHATGHLYASHQISGGSHSTHARSMRVGKGHTQRIPDANLQPVQSTDFNHGFGCPGYNIDRRVVVDGYGTDPHAHVHMNGDIGRLAARFYKRN